ncbi:AraC family transcriptional regulator [Brevibacillus reuszeri]|uniref:AraC family transcriptional regulator n=1 Tax=Brevibacillus reuszeri TaxID=54915 RepID=UPI00289CDAF7|nr:AraC family transcriptional regulator [Brevibacillus reuszeri]
MNIQDHILWWNQAIIRIIDVRRMVMEFQEQPFSYQLPASAFLYTTRGSAQISMNGSVNVIRGFHVLHGGKGVHMVVESTDVVELYLILYKATPSLSLERDKQFMLEKSSPFLENYHFSPLYPINLLDKVKQMYEEWRRSDALGKLNSKSLFYQFVHEMLWQLQQQLEDPRNPDLSQLAVRYIEENFYKEITLETLTQALHYSPQYLSKKFKEQLGCSPIHFLIQHRMEKAKELLLTTDATLQETANSVGYPDLFHFNRMFKKYVGVTPGQYKNRKLAREQIPHSTKKALRYALVSPTSERYSDDIESHFHYEKRGDFTVYTRTKASATATLLLCIMLLLSACSTAGMSMNAASGANHTANVQKTTKTVSTIFGDVEVPVKPKRVVSVFYLGSMLALGVTPVGSTDWLMKNPYFGDKVEGIEDVGTSVEKILDLQPDLIIVLTKDKAEYEKYSKIAPTVSVPYGELKSAHEELTYFGELLGREKEAADWLAEYDARIVAAKAKVDAVVPSDATFTVMEEQPKGEIYVFGERFGRGGQAIYQVLGRKLPQKVTAEMANEQYRQLSVEVLNEYAGDYLLLTSNFKTVADYKADPIWGNLAAVKNGRTYVWSEDRAWFNDPITLLSQAEELAEWLGGQPRR